MALAYCLECIDHSAEAQLTVYGEYLSFYPPECEVKIIENSSWSCAHGVERWRSDCSCGDGTPGYHHRWRKPLRVALNHLRDRISDLYESSDVFIDAWKARDEYIDVILDRSEENVNKFLHKHLSGKLDKFEKVRALSLLEMERNSLLMFTSCGWFFDEISRIEPVQIMRYAARAIELAKNLFNVDLEPPFLKLLAEAPSNVPALQDGAKIYELRAKQGRADLKQMAAYYGITSLLKDFRTEFSEGCWDMSGSATPIETGSKKLFSAGKVHVRSNITGIEDEFIFAVQYSGGTPLISCGICATDSDEPLTQEEVEELYKLMTSEDADLLYSKFGYDQFTLNNIPSNSRYRLVNELLRQDIRGLEDTMKNIVMNYDQLLEYLNLLGAKPPAIIVAAAEFTLTSSIVRKLEDHYPDLAGIKRDFEFANFWKVDPDEAQIRIAFADSMTEMLTGLCMGGLNMQAIEDLNDLIALFSEKFEWHLSLYDSQNLYHELIKHYGKKLKDEPQKLREALRKLGHALKFSDELLPA